MIPLDPFKYNTAKGLNFKMITQDQDRALRNIFRNEIKGNFLIKILHAVLDDIKFDLNEYYPLNWSLENSIASGSDIFQYDICKMIVGLHKSNMIFVSESERLKKQENQEYQNKLVSEVIDNIKLRKYGSLFFRQKQIMQGDRFLYFHIPYDLFVICMRINELLRTCKEKFELFPFYSQISNNALATLSLLEDNYLDNAYPICRSTIELYIELLIFTNYQSAFKKYNYFSSIEIYKSCCGQDYSQEFLNLYEKRKNQKESNKIKFLHFGWVDEIKDYHNKVINDPYSIGGLIKYLKKTFHKDDLDTINIIEVLYKRCHTYSHGTIQGRTYPLLHYFEICEMLRLSIVGIYKPLCDLLKANTNINEIDILAKTEKDYELLANQYNKRSTENFENYYKQNQNY